MEKKIFLWICITIRSGIKYFTSTWEILFLIWVCAYFIFKFVSNDNVRFVVHETTITNHDEQNLRTGRTIFLFRLLMTWTDYLIFDMWTYSIWQRCANITCRKEKTSKTMSSRRSRNLILWETLTHDSYTSTQSDMTTVWNDRRSEYMLHDSKWCLRQTMDAWAHDCLTNQTLSKVDIQYLHLREIIPSNDWIVAQISVDWRVHYDDHKWKKKKIISSSDRLNFAQKI